LLILENIGLTALADTAKDVLNTFASDTIFCFYGEMGAGKTTFISALVNAFGSTDLVQSPTFGLVNEYRTQDGKRLLHFDLYRLKSVDEAFESGIFELLESGNRCFLEWPERLEGALPEEFVSVKISRVGEQIRIEAERKRI
jgi:tRNA threonylcarbamoyladenosine biosynthesis protein TsaE